MLNLFIWILVYTFFLLESCINFNQKEDFILNVEIFKTSLNIQNSSAFDNNFEIF